MNIYNNLGGDIIFINADTFFWSIKLTSNLSWYCLHQIHTMTFQATRNPSFIT